MHIGIATDHGGFALKQDLMARLRAAGHDVADFGADTMSPDDDYPDFVIPLAQAVAAGTLERGVAICGSGVGASICANKIPGAAPGPGRAQARSPASPAAVPVASPGARTGGVPPSVPPPLVSAVGAPGVRAPPPRAGRPSRAPDLPNAADVVERHGRLLQLLV